MNWKVGFCLRRTSPQFLPVCIALVFNQSCFDASTAGKIEGASLAYYQLSNSFVYNLPGDSGRMGSLGYTQLNLLGEPEDGRKEDKLG